MFRFLPVAGGLDRAEPVPRDGPLPGAVLGRCSSSLDNLFERCSSESTCPAICDARVDERVFVEPEEGKDRKIVPDVRSRRARPARGAGLRAGNGIAVAEPLVVHMEQDEPVRQGFIEIIDIKSGRRVVTVIEILSPSNKFPGPGRDLYLKKQDELRAGNVSLVEIDLLRAGSRVLSAPFELIPDGHRTPYAACVRRGWKPLEFEYYRIPLA